MWIIVVLFFLFINNKISCVYCFMIKNIKSKILKSDIPISEDYLTKFSDKDLLVTYDVSKDVYLIENHYLPYLTLILA